MEFNEPKGSENSGKFLPSLALGVVEDESVHSETLHEAKTSGNGSVRHGPESHGCALWCERDEVPKVVVSGLCLRDLVVWLRLGRVDQLRD